jgi:N-acetylgalactosamine 4-sulfate 6-O-sulfotransferase
MAVAAITIGVIPFILYLRIVGVWKYYTPLELRYGKDHGNARSLSLFAFSSNAHEHHNINDPQNAIPLSSTKSNFQQSQLYFHTHITDDVIQPRSVSTDVVEPELSHDTIERSTELLVRHDNIEHRTGLRYDTVEPSTEIRHSTEWSHDVIQPRTELKHDVVKLNTELKPNVVQPNTEWGHDVIQPSTELKHNPSQPSTEWSHGVTQPSAKWSHGVLQHNDELRHQLDKEETKSKESKHHSLKIVHKLRPNTPFSDSPCTLDNSTHVPPWLKHAGHNVPELQLVQENLHKCLAAAELTDYFNRRNYTNVSMKNAARLWSMMREVVPANFSANHSNTSCWNSELYLNKCGGRNIEGRINNIPFQFSASSMLPELQTIFENYYRGKVLSSVLCMPSVFVAGFPKSGSSYVYCLIRGLAQVSRWRLMKQAEKEPHFWVPNGPHTKHQSPPQYSDIASYFLTFSPRFTGTFLPIDASPNLLFQWPHYSPQETLENYCLVPAVLPVILPSSKYIVVLRDPVTLLYSAFWFSTSTYCPSLERSQQKMGPQDFHDKIVRKIDMYNNCTLYKPVEACLETIFTEISGTAISPKQCGRLRLEIGFYYYYIRRWLAVIPREKFLFLTLDELQRNLNGVSQRIVNFLGLNPAANGESVGYTIRNQKFCRNIQSVYDYHRDPALQMRSDTKKLLYVFFDPINQKLAELLQDEKYRWKH